MANSNINDNDRECIDCRYSYCKPTTEPCINCFTNPTIKVSLGGWCWEPDIQRRPDGTTVIYDGPTMNQMTNMELIAEMLDVEIGENFKIRKATLYGFSEIGTFHFTKEAFLHGDAPAPKYLYKILTDEYFIEKYTKD